MSNKCLFTIAVTSTIIYGCAFWWVMCHPYSIGPFSKLVLLTALLAALAAGWWAFPTDKK